MHLENKTNSILYKGYHTTKKNGKHWQCSEKKNLNNILNMFGSDNTRNSVVERQIFGTTRFQFELYRVSVWINWCVSNLATEVIQLPRKRNLISSRVTVRRYLCTRIEATGMDFLGLLSSVSSGRKQVGVATCVVAYFVRREPPILSYPTDFRYFLRSKNPYSLLNSSNNFSSSVILLDPGRWYELRLIGQSTIRFKMDDK